ncbi:PH domain-containing protein [Archangium sp.]|jgi:putative membrane protein|uniref:PH domain-containing protein n=1 Tax=Archangium sp. TaxID=1872627 RepID=UPI002ED7A240
MAPASPPPFDPRGLTRPAPVLLRYYTLVSLAALAAFPIVWLVSFFRYETLKYAFGEDGVSMSWGILFRREIHLTYRRIQDIHVTRNILGGAR